MDIRPLRYASNNYVARMASGEIVLCDMDTMPAQVSVSISGYVTRSTVNNNGDTLYHQAPFSSGGALTCNLGTSSDSAVLNSQSFLTSAWSLEVSDTWRFETTGSLQYLFFKTKCQVLEVAFRARYGTSNIIVWNMRAAVSHWSCFGDENAEPINSGSTTAGEYRGWKSISPPNATVAGSYANFSKYGSVGPTCTFTSVLVS